MSHYWEKIRLIPLILHTKLTDLWNGDVQEWRIFYASFLCYTVTKIEGPYHSIHFLNLHPTLSYFQGQAKEKWQKKFILILGCFWWWTKWTMEQICIIFFFRIASYHWIPYCSGVNSSFGLTFYKFLNFCRLKICSKDQNWQRHFCVYFCFCEKVWKQFHFYF